MSQYNINSINKGDYRCVRFSAKLTGASGELFYFKNGLPILLRKYVNNVYGELILEGGHAHMAHAKY